MEQSGEAIAYYFKGTLFGFRSLLVILMLDLFPHTSNWNAIAAITGGVAVFVFEWMRFPSPWTDKLVPLMFKGAIAGLIIYPASGVLGAIGVVASLAFLSLTEKPKGVSFL